MHSLNITPSGSVLVGKTMEASCTVGSFPCQLSQISLTDIPVWDEVWEQTTFRHLCLLWQVAHSKFSAFTEWSNGNPEFKDSLKSQLPVSAGRCWEVARHLSVVQSTDLQWYHTDHQWIWCPSKSLLFSLVAVSVCRHDLPPYTARWVALLEFPKGGWRPVLGLSTFPTD